MKLKGLSEFGNLKPTPLCCHWKAVLWREASKRQFSTSLWKKATNERYWSGKIAASYKYRCAMVIYSFNLYLSLSIFSQSAGQIRRAIPSLPSGVKCDSAVGSEVVYILSSVYVCEMKQAGCDVLLAGGLVLICTKAEWRAECVHASLKFSLFRSLSSFSLGSAPSIWLKDGHPRGMH